MVLIDEKCRHLRIALLLGSNGRGSEGARFAKQVLSLVGQVRKNVSFHVSQYELNGSSLSPSTLQACRECDAVLHCGLAEAAGKDLLEELGGDVNVTPVRFASARIAERSAYLSDAVDKLDITFIRDLADGVVSERPRKEAADNDAACDTTRHSRGAIERLARWAGVYATRSGRLKPVHLIAGPDVMATSRLWRSTVTEIFARELTGAASMQLASSPTNLNGIVLADNIVGDILSGQARGIVSS